MKNDLKEFDKLKDLDNLPVIKALTTTFPNDTIKLKYAEHRVQHRELEPDIGEFNILNMFMKHDPSGLAEDGTTGVRGQTSAARWDIHGQTVTRQLV